MSVRWSIQIEKIGSAYIYVPIYPIYSIYPIHILYTLRWWFHLGSAYLHIFADDLHWPELEMLLESIGYHEAAGKASFFGSMCEDSLMAAIHFERRFDALMKYVINSQEHPIGKVKDFIYRVQFKIRGSCHYLVTAYFFLDWKYTPGYQLWHSWCFSSIY